MNAGGLAMNGADIRRKQGIVTAVLAQFRKARSEPAVKLVLAPCPGKAPEHTRGLCNYDEIRPVRQREEQATAIEELPPVATCETSNMPPAFQNLDEVPRIADLYVGEYLHFLVVSTFPGHLHLFNFGTDGDVARLYPLPEKESQYVAPCHWRYVSGPDGSAKALYREQGPANIYPERIIAIITRENIPLKPSDLYPGWDIYDGVSPVIEMCGARGGRGDVGADDDDFGQPDRSADWFWDRPTEDWQWGLIEVPVKDRPGD
jgi:hypothetical protein